MVVGLVVCLVKFADLLPTYATEANDLTKHVEDGLAQLGLSTGATSDALSKLDPAKLAEVLGDLVSGILGALGFLFFLVTLMFFFVVAVPGFAPRVAALQRSKPELAAALGKFLRGSQTYLLMTALFGAIVGVLDAGALWLLGVPLPLVWGFFSFLTNFIPNIGFIIGVIPPAFLALLDDGWEALLWVIVVYSVLNVTIQTFIQPRIVGQLGRAQRRDHLHVTRRLDIPARRARCAPGRADDAAPPSDLHRRRQSCILGGPADRRAGRGRETRRRPRTWWLTPPGRHDWLRFGTVTFERETAGCTTSVPA